MSFENIVKILTNEKEVYRNRFIEPEDPDLKKEELEVSPIGVGELPSRPIPQGMNRALRKLPQSQREEILKGVKRDQGKRIEVLQSQLDRLNENAISGEISDREVSAIVKIGDEINKLEIQIERSEGFLKSELAAQHEEKK